MWTWLMGPYVVAHYRVYQDREAALALLQPFEDHLRDSWPVRHQATPTVRVGV